jgi:hypothetical protein
MKWSLSVPKMAHFYWGGGKLLYMRYLTIKSFIKYNPDWKVVFHYPKEPFKGRSWYTDMYPPKINEAVCKDYLPEVMKLDIIKNEVDFRALGASKNMAEVHKNDYIRVHVLKLYGGLWSDMDIIYFKPISELAVNKPENQDKKVFVCIANYGHSTGFNMAVPESEFFTTLSDRMNNEYLPSNYQCWGPDMWNKHFKRLRSIPGGCEIGMDAVYAHNCHVVKELLGDKPRFTKDSIGCHWYGGHTLWPDFWNRTAGGEKNLPKSIIQGLIEQV